MITFNNSILKVSGYWLTPEPPPAPEPIAEGTIRFNFLNTSIDPNLRGISTYGSWSPVLDSNTGRAIPGLWDYVPANYTMTLRGQLESSNLDIAHCGGSVDLVDIRLSSLSNNSFFDNAFEGATALRTVNISSLTAPSYRMIHAFQGCSGITEASVLLDTCSSTEAMFGACTGLRTLYMRTGNGLSNGTGYGCTALTDLTLEISSGDGWFLYQNGHSDFSGAPLTNITFIAPVNSTYMLHGISSGADQETFKDLTTLESVILYVRDPGSSTELLQRPLPIGSNGNYCFQGCTGLTAMPYLDLSAVRKCVSMFANCVNIGSGILDTYNVLSLHVQQYDYNNCYHNCGINSPAGSAELAQIPSSWK